jgi:2-amino-4-hydroxy-6-hydroxymethyldihydropteridine diphosphokinase
MGHLRAAVATLRTVDPGLRVSPVYETAPVGGPEQGPYLNCVVELGSAPAPLELLALAHRLETAAARARTIPNGPRTLDVDILLIGDLRLSTPELTVPHPRMFERGFVLAPLEDLDPSLVPPDWRSTVAGAALLDTEVRLIGTLDGS